VARRCGGDLAKSSFIEPKDEREERFIKRFRAWVVERRVDRNNWQVSDDRQSISADELASQGLDPGCINELLRGKNDILASEILSAMAEGWRPEPGAPGRQGTADARLARSPVPVVNSLPVARAPKAWKARPGTKLTKSEDAVLAAVSALWPDGEIDHKAGARDRKIQNWLKPKNQSPVSVRVIQRALEKIHFA
jgi:hypothetical protein